MKVKLYNSLEKSLIRDWEILWKASPFSTVFNSPNWYESYLDSYGADVVRIVAIYKINKLVSLAPLVKTRLFGISVYVTVGSDFCQRSGVLCDYEDFITTRLLFSRLSELGLVYFTHLDETNYKNMKNLVKGLTPISHRISPYINLRINSDGELVLAKRRQILKKALNEVQNFKLKTYDEGLANVIPLIFEIDRKSTKSKNGYATFFDEKVKEFFKLLSVRSKKNILINVLYYKGKPIAYEIGFKEKNIYIDSQRAYLPEYAHLTPGKVLMVLVAEMLAKRGYEVFDLGPGVDNLKKSLAKNENTYFNLILSKSGVISAYLKAVFVLRNKIYNIIFRHKSAYSLIRKISK
jgi:CelD/BcsL family acetyltransferase involved in cellulose biosynthesis